MESQTNLCSYELIHVIVRYGAGSKVIKLAKQNGAKGGTITFCKGTCRNFFLELLDLTDVRRELVLIVVPKNIASSVTSKLDAVFHFCKPNHGILFTTSILSVCGSHNLEAIDHKKYGGNAQMNYHAIYTIVDKGNAETAMEAATKAGAKGGTIINARGSGIHETSMVFAMEIEPEKEILLILCQISLVDEVIQSIRNALSIDEPGNGIIFTQEINQTVGIA